MAPLLQCISSICEMSRSQCLSTVEAGRSTWRLSSPTPRREQAGSFQVLRACKDTDSATSQDNTCKCLTTPTVKMFKFHLLYVSLCPFLSPGSPERSLLLLLIPISHQACIPIDKFPQSLLFSSPPNLSSANTYSSPSLCTDPTAVSPL